MRLPKGALMKTKDFIITDCSTAQEDATIGEVAELIKEKNYLAVFSADRRFLGLATPSTVLGRPDTPLRDCLRGDPPCRDEDDIADTLNVFFKQNIFVLPVLSSKDASFLGVVNLYCLLSSMRSAQFGVSAVSVNKIVGPLDFENAKDRFLDEFVWRISDPLQRISSLANILKTAETDSARQLNCYSIEAAVDQISKTLRVFAGSFTPSDY